MPPLPRVVRRMKTSSSEPPACLSWARGVQGDDPAAVEHGQSIAQSVGFVHVVRGQHDGGVVLLAQAQHHALDVLFRARVEAGGRLVEQQQHRRVSSARAMATFCCMPRDMCSIGSSATLRLIPRLSRISSPRWRASRRRGRTAAPAYSRFSIGLSFLKNAASTLTRLISCLTSQLVADDVQAEDFERAAVGQQQRRDDANQRRLARAVGAEDAEDLARVRPSARRRRRPRLASALASSATACAPRGCRRSSRHRAARAQAVV